MPTSATPPPTTRRSQRLILRLLPAIAALLLLIGLGCYLLVTNALSQDADVQQRSRVFIARTLEQVRNEVGRNIINYAKWGEAYKHLHLTVDKVWADEQRNVGDIPYQLYGYDGVLVLDAQDRTVYAVIDGKPATLQASDWLQGDLAALVAAARASHDDNDGVVRALSVGGVPALAAAATISAGWDPQIQVTPGPQSVMLFVSILDPGKLAHLSETYGLPELTVSGQAIEGLDSMRLLGSGIRLNWSAPQPGRHLLEQTLPVFFAGVLVLAIVLVLVLRHALASARQVDAQVAALLASQAELRHQSQHDFLTGLPNRFQLYSHLLQRLDVQQQALTVLSLDLDRFKPINDRYGHAVGDRVLQQVALRLRALAPAESMVARLGGDEFILVLFGTREPAEIESLCRQIVAALGRPIRLETEDAVVGTSIGVAHAPAQAHTTTELLRNADVALYQAKAAGRNTWRGYVAPSVVS